MGVSLGRELAIELAAAFRSAIFRHAIEARLRRETSGHSSEAAYYVDGDTLPPGLAQGGQQTFQNIARTALHQKDGSRFRLAATEKIAHSFEYSVVLA
jgi:hypothetical protein